MAWGRGERRAEREADRAGTVATCSPAADPCRRAMPPGRRSPAGNRAPRSAGFQPRRLEGQRHPRPVRAECPRPRSEAIPGRLFGVSSLARSMAICRGRAIEAGRFLHESLSAGCFPQEAPPRVAFCPVAFESRPAARTAGCRSGGPSPRPRPAWRCRGLAVSVGPAQRAPRDDGARRPTVSGCCVRARRPSRVGAPSAPSAHRRRASQRPQAVLRSRPR